MQPGAGGQAAGTGGITEGAAKPTFEPAGYLIVLQPLPPVMPRSTLVVAASEADETMVRLPATARTPTQNGTLEKDASSTGRRRPVPNKRPR